MSPLHEPLLYIHGMGHFHPDSVIDNDFIKSLEIGADSDWTVERVGIRSRRTVLSLDYIRETKNVDRARTDDNALYSNAQTASKAAVMALERARLSPTDIGMVISGSCSPQYTAPAEACRIAAELGIRAPAFDLNSACSSFAAHLHLLRGANPFLLPKYALVVYPENNTRAVDYRDRSAAVLWGDGSAAAVVSTQVPSRMRVRKSDIGSEPADWEKVVIPTGAHFSQDGKAVQAFAIRKSVELTRRLLSEVDEPSSAYWIGHQANLTMLTSTCARAGIPAERHLYNVDVFGNCGAAGAPSVLSQNWDRFVPGDRVAVAVVGAGLTWGGLLIEVNDEVR